MAEANGKAMLVSTKAIGHAITNCLSHMLTWNASGPAMIRYMMPDIDRAIMQVMIIWVIIIVRLFIIRSLVVRDDAAIDCA